MEGTSTFITWAIGFFMGFTMREVIALILGEVPCIMRYIEESKHFKFITK